MTEILVEADATSNRDNGESESKEIEVIQPQVLKVGEEIGQQPEKPNQCAHYFGYLSQRSAKGEIPEECMVCENIVSCMLKKVTG